MAEMRQFTVMVHQEDGSMWAEVKELPGCFASGRDFDELKEALIEAIDMCLPEGYKIDDPASVTFEPLNEMRVRVPA